MLTPVDIDSGRWSGCIEPNYCSAFDNLPRMAIKVFGTSIFKYCFIIITESSYYHCVKTYVYAINRNLLGLSGIKNNMINHSFNSGQYFKYVF